MSDYQLKVTDKLTMSLHHHKIQGHTHVVVTRTGTIVSYPSKPQYDGDVWLWDGQIGQPIIHGILDMDIILQGKKYNPSKFIHEIAGQYSKHVICERYVILTDYGYYVRDTMGQNKSIPETFCKFTPSLGRAMIYTRKKDAENRINKFKGNTVACLRHSLADTNPVIKLVKTTMILDDDVVL